MKNTDKIILAESLSRAAAAAELAVRAAGDAAFAARRAKADADRVEGARRPLPRPAVAHAIETLNATAFVSKARLAELEEAERLLAATVARVQAADHLANVAAAIATGLRVLAVNPDGGRPANALDAAVDRYRAAGA